MGKLVSIDWYRKGIKMESIYEIAKYFLSKSNMSHKKLQKLCYYAQAWHLANYDVPLVANRFEAWVHGPVAPDLYSVYKNYGWMDIPRYNQELNLNQKTVNFLDIVYNTYGNFTGEELEKKTHNEEPWEEARKGLISNEYSRTPISMETMRRYYGSRIGKRYE